MKKVFLITSLVILASLISGCGKETLTCTMNQDNSMAKMKQEIIATFNGNKAKTVEAIITMEMDKSYKNHMNDLKSSIEEEMKDYEKQYDVKTKISVDGTTLKYSMEADSDKMSKEARTLFGFDTNAKQTKDDAKKQLEEAGYTCK